MIRRDDVDENGVIPFDETTIQLLDNTVPGGIKVIEQPRPDWIATISAGFKKTNNNGVSYPAVERGGVIHIPDPRDEAEAPGLAAALARDPKRLTIAVCSDNPYEVVTQRWVHYSSTAIDIFGDATRVTHVTATPKKDQEKAEVRFDTHYVGSKEYADLVRLCKPETSFFFVLVEWTADGSPRMTWPDGFKPYRLRFTSRNSAVSVLGQLIQQRKFFGSLIGIPWELSIDYRDVVGPDPERGFARHNVPVWQIKIVRPGGIQIDSGWMRGVLAKAAQESQVLRALPAPRYEVEQALLDAPDIDLDEAVAESLAHPAPPADAQHWRGIWHKAVKDDPLLSTDAGRHRFVARFTSARWPQDESRWTESLEDFLAHASEADANALIAKLDEAISALLVRRGARSTTATVDPDPPREPEPTEPASAPVQPEPDDPGEMEHAAVLADEIEGSFRDTSIDVEPEAPSGFAHKASLNG